MRAYVPRQVFTFVMFGAIVVAAATGSRAAFDGPTSSVELPSFRPDEIGNPVVLAEGLGSDPAALKLTLLNPDAPLKGVLETYEVVADSATGSWRIEGVTKTKTRKPIAALTLSGGALKFQWQPGIVRTDGGALRNCVLLIGGATDQAVALRVPLRQPALTLDFTKEIVRVPLIDDLPDENYLLLDVHGITEVQVSGELSQQSGKVKEPVFVGIKRTDADVPGARMRLVLWKTSLKPEVIVRPELVPVLPQSAAAAAAPPATVVGTTVIRPATTRPAVATNADGADPTKPNPVNLPYTIRSLAAAKTAINGQLTAAKQRIIADRQGIIVRQNEIAKYGDTIIGTQEEIDAILAKLNRLRAEINALAAEVTKLEQEVVPGLNKQLAAFEPLEKLGNSLHQKAKLGFRVYYLVAGKPIDVLVVGDETATK